MNFDTLEATAELDYPVRLRIAAWLTFIHQWESDPYLGYDIDHPYVEKILNEIWCLRNGIDPAIVPEDTWYQFTTASIIQSCMFNPEFREERLAFLVCTLKHI